MLLLQLAIIAHAPIDTGQLVNFHAMAQPETVFVGQQVTYQVGVFLDDQLRLRLRRNPEFVPPETRAMLAYDLPSSAGTPGARRVGAHDYEVHVFERALFPLEAGRYVIPAAQLTYSLPLSLSFFSREETHTLAAESVAVVALPPPLAGRPGNYTGAVGELSVAERVDTHVARAGDPIVVTVAVAGRANIKLLPRPALAIPWGSAVAADERVRVDTSTGEVKGSKEFDWVVTPRDTGALAMPVVNYVYFNPYTEKYELAVTRPDTVRVRAGSLAPLDTVRVDAAPPLPIRTAFRGSVPPPLYSRPEFFAVAALAPLPALLLAGRRRVERRRRRPITAAARLRALARRRGGAIDAPALRRAYVAALAERFALPPATLTERGGLARVLRREGVTGPSGMRAEGVLATLDRCAYGAGTAADASGKAGAETGGQAGAGTGGKVSAERGGESAAQASGKGGARSALPDDMCAQAYAVFVVVAREARRRIVPVVLVAMALLAGGVAVASAVDTSEEQAATAFRQGLSAYGRHQYALAATRFAAAAHVAPRAADAWADAGTAAWAAADTVDAVVGWQRAARLEPFARDVRERLALVRSSQEGPIAEPPRVSAEVLACAALACWVLTCLLLLRVRVTRATLVLGATAGVLALGAMWLDDRTTGARLVVLGAGNGLSASPALGAERVAAIDAGDVGRVEARDGAWVRVRLDGDREGWIEVARVTSLGD